MTFNELVNSIFGNFFLAISESWFLQVLFGLWLLLALANKERRQKLINNIAFFLRMPLTYGAEQPVVVDDENRPLYPQSWFEAAHSGLKSILVKPVKTIQNKLSDAQNNIVEDFEWTTILHGCFLALFIYADMVGV